MKNALLLIDIQNDYFPQGRMELEGSLAAAQRAKTLLDLFREKNWPIFHIQHISTRPTASFFLPGTPGAEIHEVVKPVGGEAVIQKNFPNSFRNTDLLARLQKMEIQGLVICGMMTHMCVDATVRAAFDHGFECVTVHDACATKALQFKGEEIPAVKVHSSFLAALTAVYTRALTSQETIAHLTGS